VGEGGNASSVEAKLWELAAKFSEERAFPSVAKSRTQKSSAYDARRASTMHR
jgi:hypothetical protein